MGIIALVTCWIPVLGILLGIAAIIIGVKAKKESPESSNESTFSIIGIVTGALSIVPGVILTAIMACGALAYTSAVQQQERVRDRQQLEQERREEELQRREELERARMEEEMRQRREALERQSEEERIRAEQAAEEAAALRAAQEAAEKRAREDRNTRRRRRPDEKSPSRPRRPRLGNPADDPLGGLQL